MKRCWLCRAGLLLLLLSAALWLYWPALYRPAIADSVLPMSPAQIERGAYLARAGNCIACHTQPGAPEYSGGRRIATPFGDVYSSNLTPDVDTGLGAWRAADFYRALHEGRSRDGRLLTPAFPYPNYTRITRADSDALLAYLRTLPPVRRAPRAAELRFPYNTSLALQLWRRLYFRPAEFAADAQRSASWNRGAYLVEGLGHCNACHARRDWLGGVRDSRAYAGGEIAGLDWEALPLTREPPLDDAQAGEWLALLSSGVSQRHAVSGPMAEVVFHSLQYLHREDLAAMIEYLRSLPGEAQTPKPDRINARLLQTLQQRGEQVYGEHCADCHGEQGEGKPSHYPALAGSRLLGSPSPANAIRIVLYGGYPPSTAANPMPYGMPPFRPQLRDEDVAAVLTYVRSAWGNQAGAVLPAQVAKR